MNSRRTRGLGHRGAAGDASCRASRARGAAAAWCARVRGYDRTARAHAPMYCRCHLRLRSMVAYGGRRFFITIVVLHTVTDHATID